MKFYVEVDYLYEPLAFSNLSDAVAYSSKRQPPEDRLAYLETVVGVLLDKAPFIVQKGIAEGLGMETK